MPGTSPSTAAVRLRITGCSARRKTSHPTPGIPWPDAVAGTGLAAVGGSAAAAHFDRLRHLALFFHEARRLTATSQRQDQRWLLLSVMPARQPAATNPHYRNHGARPVLGARDWAL
jgi:hypothetical protein